MERCDKIDRKKRPEKTTRKNRPEKTTGKNRPEKTTGKYTKVTVIFYTLPIGLTL
jgi:hypothetical protein